MILIRPVQLPADREALLRLDTSFRTSVIYEVQATPESFALVEQPVDPPIHKSFPLDDELGPDRLWEDGFVVEDAGKLVGFLALRYEAWNRRAVIWHLYVAPERRGSGVGKHLIAEAVQWAHRRGARCLWLEVTNVNYPAIQFYRRVGFQFCGLDQSLYDPAGEADGEAALFFMRHLA